jgi:hypothetical protein
VSENWPISKINPPANKDGYVARRAWHEAMKAAGWVPRDERPDLFAVGDTALVSMDNGHEAWATITRFYKNGAVGVIQNGERLNARGVWKRLRENKADQSFIRRTPSREGSKRAYRYTYDVDAATRVNVKAKPKEKLRIPYRGVPGHYEVVARLASDVVGVIHDETRHPMAISDLALRELARDVYRPAEDATSQEDVRYRHEREDALPRSRDDAYQAILDASGIKDHDFARADDAYRKWKAGKGKRRVKPPPLTGGQLDAFEGDLRGRHFTSLLEAFEHATRGAKTWRDLTPALALLRDVKGFKKARFPNEVYERHTRHDLDLDEQGHTIDVDLYGVTMTPDMDVNEAVFLASTMTPPRLWEPLSEEAEARAARDDQDEYDEWLDG